MPLPGQVGDRIAGRYEVFEIHQGGMGIVYLATDRLKPPGREVVALKTLRDEILSDRHRRARFATECQLWVRFGRHPHIVQAHAVEEIEGKPCLVLECATGGELRGRIGTPRLDPPQALRYGIEFCLGMEHAIRQGLRCHRDIKPGNLLLGGDGSLKITDFGLAGLRDDFLAAGLDGTEGPIPLVEPLRSQPIIWTDAPDRKAGVVPPIPPMVGLADPTGSSTTDGGSHSESTLVPSNERADPEATADYLPPAGASFDLTEVPRLTRTGVLLGTLPYMAPEQFQDAKHVDVRADIYSFGVVLHQMLTSELPFKGKTADMLKHQHLHQEPPSVASAIPRRFAREAGRIDDLVSCCLAKDPWDRFASMPALRQAMTGILRRIGPR